MSLVKCHLVTRALPHGVMEHLPSKHPAAPNATLSVAGGKVTSVSLGACWKHRIHESPQPQNQEFTFHKVLCKRFKCMLEFEKDSTPCKPISLIMNYWARVGQKHMKPLTGTAGKLPKRKLASALGSRCTHYWTKRSKIDFLSLEFSGVYT